MMRTVAAAAAGGVAAIGFTLLLLTDLGVFVSWGVAGLLAAVGFLLGLTNSVARARATIFFICIISIPALILVFAPMGFSAWFIPGLAGIAVWLTNPLRPHPRSGHIAAVTGSAAAIAWLAAATALEIGPAATDAPGAIAESQWAVLSWTGRAVMVGLGAFLAYLLGKSVRGVPKTKRDRIVTYRQDPNNKAALVFVHGFLGDARDTWESLANQLLEDPRIQDWDIYSFGYSTSLNLEFSLAWTADPDLVTVTKGLRTMAEHSDKLARYETYAIAAHSMGGLITQRALVDDPDLRKQVDVVMMFGTPSAGVSAKGLGFLNRQVATMAPDSTFITDLRKRWTELYHNGRPRFDFYAIAGLEDNFINPETSLGPFPEEQQRALPGNHLEMIEASAADDPVVQLVIGMLLREGDDALPWNGAQLAIERGEFHEAIQTFSGHVEELDAHTLRRLALAYAATGESDQAMAVLEKHLGRAGTDGMGILGGQFKRRWMTGRRASDGDRAVKLYGDAYQIAHDAEDHEQAYYHAINLAFMALAYEQNQTKSRELAQSALEHCAHADDNVWRTATEAEANLYLGNTQRAMEGYRAAMALGPDVVQPSMAHSMYQQAQAIADALGDPALSAAIDDVFVRAV